jgi:hypothetical protein
MCRVRSCCCCWDVHFGSLLLSIIGGFVCLIQLLYACIVIKDTGASYNVTMIISCCMGLVLYIVLFIGAATKNILLVLIFIVVDGAVIALQSVGVILLFVAIGTLPSSSALFGFMVGLAVGSSIALGLALYFWSVVYSMYCDLKDADLRQGAPTYMQQ